MKGLGEDSKCKVSFIVSVSLLCKGKKDRLMDIKTLSLSFSVCLSRFVCLSDRFCFHIILLCLITSLLFCSSSCCCLRLFICSFSLLFCLWWCLGLFVAVIAVVACL